MRDSFIAGLLNIARLDEKVVLLTADLGFGVLNDFQSELPKQFINVGIAEQNMIGVATGMAREGYIVFCYSIGNFPTLRCLEQIRNDASYHNANVKIISVGGGLSYGPLGMSHHATEDLAILRSIPGVEVIIPSTTPEAKEAANYLYKNSGVKYLRLDKSYAEHSCYVKSIDLSKWNVLSVGQEICLISAGGILEEIIDAEKHLAQRGIEVGVISARNLNQSCSKEIYELISKYSVIISVEEHVKVGGLGGFLAELICDYGKNIRLIRLGVLPENISRIGSQKFLRGINGLTSESILDLFSTRKLF